MYAAAKWTSKPIYRFHAEQSKRFLITPGMEGFKRSNIVNIEGLEISE